MSSLQGGVVRLRDLCVTNVLLPVLRLLTQWSSKRLGLCDNEGGDVVSIVSDAQMELWEGYVACACLLRLERFLCVMLSPCLLDALAVAEQRPRTRVSGRSSRGFHHISVVPRQLV